MEEAYTVGIRLLLENGVSPGLTVIGQELAGADRAIAATQAGLERLSGLARDATLAPGKAMARQGVAQQPTPPMMTVADGPSKPANSPLPPLAPAVPATPTRPADPPPGLPGRPAAPIVSPERVSPLPKLPAAISVSPPPARLLSVSIPSISGLREPQRAVPQLAARPAAPALIPAPVSPRLSDFAGYAPPQLKVSLPNAGAASPPAPLPSATAPVMLPALITPPAVAPHAAMPMVVAPPIGREGASVVSSPPARSATPGGGGTGGAADAPNTRPASGAAGGDVFLDGMRVGRWMARELGRQAGGPQAAATAFDPRASPVWPGALQGS